MGAYFITEAVKPMTKEALATWFAERIEELRFEYGNDGYNGTLTTNNGLVFTGQAFSTESAAIRWLEESVEKWGPVLAVRYGDWPELFEDSPKGRVLVTKRKELESARQTFEVDVIRRTKSGKSRTKGCKCCGSSIAVSHIHETPRRDQQSAMECPVCGHEYLLTETDVKRRKSLETRLRDALQKERDERARHEARQVRAEAGWLIGALCAS